MCVCVCVCVCVSQHNTACNGVPVRDPNGSNNSGHFYSAVSLHSKGEHTSHYKMSSNVCIKTSTMRNYIVIILYSSHTTSTHHTHVCVPPHTHHIHTHTHTTNTHTHTHTHHKHTHTEVHRKNVMGWGASKKTVLKSQITCGIISRIDGCF